MNQVMNICHAFSDGCLAKKFSTHQGQKDGWFSAPARNVSRRMLMLRSAKDVK